jgi:hypothetical protein
LISFIVPSVGRPSLHRTLQSIEYCEGDEIILVGARPFVPIEPPLRFVQCDPGGDWGHTERTRATPFAEGNYIAHIDDDDTYAPGTRKLMAEAIREAQGKPIMFRMRFPNGITLWEDKTIRCGNLGTPMFLLPNEQHRFGTWEPFVGGDCKFLEQCGWTADEFLWRPEVIAHLGHNT